MKHEQKLRNFRACQKVCRVGESGAGKTTLLNILGGMDTLTEGRVFPPMADRVIRARNGRVTEVITNSARAGQQDRMVKSTLREIGTSLTRYLAIFAIVALGVGFFSGLKIFRDCMVKTASDYINIIERTLEIATIKVLGFRPLEVSGGDIVQSVVLTFAFAIFVGLAMQKRLRDVSMT